MSSDDRYHATGERLRGLLRGTHRSPTRSSYDVVVIGGGHNGLTAAAYLARAGLSVLVTEAADQLGGATASVEAFKGVPARLSRYAYLVSLLPDKIVSDLGLRFEARSRTVASYTPTYRAGVHGGLFVGRGAATEHDTATSFAALTGSGEEYRSWLRWYERCERFARAVAPTLLEPLRAGSELRSRFGDDASWEMLVEQPLGETLEREFTDDTVRGVVLTDGLIGTASSAHDPSLAQNRCFAYHVIGNGTGEWKVPVGGMASLVAELARAASANGAELVCGAAAVRIETDGTHAEVHYADGRRVGARYVLCAASPAALERLRARTPSAPDDGCQLKMNMLLTRLPRLRSGEDPSRAFAGTFHLDEDYPQLERAAEQAARGCLPDIIPAEMYCHSLTDDTILAPSLAARGMHTLTLFGLHVPAAAFDADNSAVRDEAVRRLLRQLNERLDEPVESLIAQDTEGRACIEAKSPLDLEADVSLPRGNIFHRALRWPYAEDDREVGTWGVETEDTNVLLCGAGARRGGGVSGVPGHNAAQAVLSMHS